MLTQIYEVSSPAEASALCELGVDHIGILLGEGLFPREQPLASAAAIAAAVKRPSVVCALFLTAETERIAAMARLLAPDILHLGAAPELLSPQDCALLKKFLPGVLLMRSIPVTGEEALLLARSYEGAADFLLLDSHTAGDTQIGALGTTHDWRISARIARAARMPVLLAGGLGPENVAEAIRSVRPAGVDSKTKTDHAGAHSKNLAAVRAFVRAAREAAASP